MNSEKMPEDMEAGEWRYAVQEPGVASKVTVKGATPWNPQGSCALYAAFGEVVEDHHHGPIAHKQDTELTRDILVILD